MTEIVVMRKRLEKEVNSSSLTIPADVTKHREKGGGGGKREKEWALFRRRIPAQEYISYGCGKEPRRALRTKLAWRKRRGKEEGEKGEKRLRSSEIIDGPVIGEETKKKGCKYTFSHIQGN